MEIIYKPIDLLMVLGSVMSFIYAYFIGNVYVVWLCMCIFLFSSVSVTGLERYKTQKESE